MSNSLIYNFDEVLKNVRKIGNTFYWECPICGWYLNEKADYEEQQEPRNFETIESIAKDPLCMNCRKF